MYPIPFAIGSTFVYFNCSYLFCSELRLCVKKKGVFVRMGYQPTFIRILVMFNVSVLLSTTFPEGIFYQYTSFCLILLLKG
ncbi:hypothetical protein BY458DRAFT_80264 [Sporodiniella umbellata]|nr:hypothetical protein BY458DRAFT_80264 [Sporodiniella umbellata]